MGMAVKIHGTRSIIQHSRYNLDPVPQVSFIDVPKRRRSTMRVRLNPHHLPPRTDPPRSWHRILSARNPDIDYHIARSKLIKKPLMRSTKIERPQSNRDLWPWKSP